MSGWQAGAYTVSFMAAQRADYAARAIQVLVDGAVVDTFTPATTDYVVRTTPAFTVTAGSHTLKFQGYGTSGDTTLIDQVFVRPVAGGILLWDYNDLHILEGVGANIGGTADQFHFASQSYTGNAIAVANVTYQENTNSNAKAGVMFRDSTSPGARYVDVVVLPGSNNNARVSLQYRQTADQAAVSAATTADMPFPVWVKLERDETTDAFKGYYSADGTTWTQVGAQITVDMNTTAQVGLAVTSSNTSSASTAIFTNVQVTDKLAGADVGSPLPAGSTAYAEASDTYTVIGGGADIFGTADQFQFAQKSFSGNGDMFAQVYDVTDSDPFTHWSKAGVMWRSGTGASDVYAAMLLSPVNGLVFQARTSTPGSTTVVHAENSRDLLNPGSPVWVKLVRNGSTFSGYYFVGTGRPSASDWKLLSSATISSMPTAAKVGLAVTSHNQGTSATAQFKNVDPHSLDPAMDVLATSSETMVAAWLAGNVPTKVVGWSEQRESDQVDSIVGRGRESQISGASREVLIDAAIEQRNGGQAEARRTISRAAATAWRDAENSNDTDADSWAGQKLRAARPMLPAAIDLALHSA